jgi:hypothetical protein
MINPNEVFPGLEFDEPNHKYTLEGKRLLSTTGFISKYASKFDAYYWSDFKSNKRGDELEGLEPAKIRDMWNKKGKESMQRGTDVHKAIEQYLLTGKIEGLKYLQKQVQDILVTWGVWWQGMKKSMSVEAIELIMCNPEWNLAGMADLIVKDASGKLHMMDWKTGEKPIDEPAFRNAKMVYPFNMLPDSNFGKYSAQLSFYKAMLGARGIEIHNLICVHITDEKVTTHKMTDVSEIVPQLMNIKQ